MNTLTRTIKNVTALLLLITSSTALATGTMRCSGHIIDQGMTKSDIIAHCGPPTMRKENDTYWYYDRGETQLITRLFFVDDQVEFIDDVPRDE